MPAKCEYCSRVSKTKREKPVKFGYGTYKEITLECAVLEFDGVRPTSRGLEQCCDYYSAIGNPNPMPIAWEGPPQTITESEKSGKTKK